VVLAQGNVGACHGPLTGPLWARLLGTTTARPSAPLLDEEVKRAVHAGSCDVGNAATAVSSLDGSWAEELCRVAPLPTHLCRDLVVITTHPYEAMCAAGGLISHLAAQGADVEILAVTDGAGAASGAIDGAPLRHRSRRRGHILAAYRRLGVPEVRRHRLQLESGKVSDAQPDLVAALSELVGHDCYPGLWCLAPWRRDGHPDHDAVGLVAEAVCRTYNLRLVRYLCAAWEWLRPEDLPWRRVRQFTLSDNVRASKDAAVALPPGVPGREWVADRELFLV
jgi:LmbE family N-acetylglucosaminyl deacetylase